MRCQLIMSVVAICVVGNDVKAWNGEEHVAVGYNGYGRACLNARAAYSNLPEPASARLRLACGIVGERVPQDTTSPVVAFTYAPLAGDWSRLAADHTETPDQLTSARLGDLVVGYGHMASIAINN